jgi:hypothetical protein
VISTAPDRYGGYRVSKALALSILYRDIACELQSHNARSNDNHLAER